MEKCYECQIECIEKLIEDGQIDFERETICVPDPNMSMLSAMVITDGDGDAFAVQIDLGIAGKASSVQAAVRELAEGIGHNLVSEPDSKCILPCGDVAYILPLPMDYDAVVKPEAYTGIKEYIEKAFHVTMPVNPDDVLWVSFRPILPSTNTTND